MTDTHIAPGALAARLGAQPHHLDKLIKWEAIPFGRASRSHPVAEAGVPIVRAALVAAGYARDERRAVADAARSAPARALTPNDVATALGVGTTTVLARIASGELTAVNVSRSRHAERPRWRVARSALDAFLTSRPAPPHRLPRADERHRV